MAARRAHLQYGYLRNPLPPGEGICAVCRADATVGYPVCRVCATTFRTAEGVCADAVVPVSYAVRGQQHAYNLIRYKEAEGRSAQLARYDLSLLLADFLRRHLACLTSIAGGPFTHLATVPSTRDRQGVHPLVRLASASVTLPAPEVEVNGRYRSDDRAFHSDRFKLSQSFSGARFLLVDDTWTTGRRVQSLAHVLKRADASSVVSVVLGRWVNPAWSPAKPLLDRIKARRFDPEHCACDDPDALV